MPNFPIEDTLHHISKLVLYFAFSLCIVGKLIDLASVVCGLGLFRVELLHGKETFKVATRCPQL